MELAKGVAWMPEADGDEDEKPEAKKTKEETIVGQQVLKRNLKLKYCVLIKTPGEAKWTCWYAMKSSNEEESDNEEDEKGGGRGIQCRPV